MKIAVVGAHLKGLPLHHQLVERNAQFVGASRTQPIYQFFALPGTNPPKPGLLRSLESQPKGIEVEVYELEPIAFATFVESIPSPLTIGNIELETGNSVKGFLVESYAAFDAEEITTLGGWRAYLDYLKQ